MKAFIVIVSLIVVLQLDRIKNLLIYIAEQITKQNGKR